MDVLTKEQRSRNMAAIRGKNTRPELVVRSLLHRLGYRYALHRSDLPGKPDIVLVRRLKVIFVHGCFWHLHRCRFGNVMPATNAAFWKDKRLKNTERDKIARLALKRAGWQIFVVWGCWIKQPDELAKRLLAFLKKPSPKAKQKYLREPSAQRGATKRPSSTLQS